MFFFTFNNKNETISPFNVNSSREIYIYYLYQHNVCVTEHFSADLVYSRYGPLEIYMDPVGEQNIRTYLIRDFVAVDFTLHNDY